MSLKLELRPPTPRRWNNRRRFGRNIGQKLCLPVLGDISVISCIKTTEGVVNRRCSPLKGTWWSCYIPALEVVGSCSSAVRAPNFWRQIANCHKACCRAHFSVWIFLSGLWLRTTEHWTTRICGYYLEKTPLVKMHLSHDHHANILVPLAYLRIVFSYLITYSLF